LSNSNHYFQIRIACSAHVEPGKLFQLDDEVVELSDSQRVLMDDLAVKAGDVSF
jgi:hypothetical protein